MALCWSIHSPIKALCFVLWMLVVTVCGVESSSSSEHPPGLKTISSLLTVNNLGHYRKQRSTDDHTFQSIRATSKFNKDIDSLNHSKNTLVSEQNEDDDVVQSKGKNMTYEANEDEVKLKHNKQDKINFNSKYSKIALNESNNEKQKLNFLGVQGLKYNSFKKEIKLSPDNNDRISKLNLSNPAVPDSYNFENIKTLTLTELETKTDMTDDIKMNETRVMSDQPAPIDNLLNATDLPMDDSLDLFSDNTTSKPFDDGNRTSSADSRTMPTTEGWDILVVSGIILGTLMFISVVASGGYVVYRRRIWNKPQTLSDKCSNADSSGYIDDSTIRENSEEMYSLDNDSFLNSLEAMTIQNYWTDNVKHTKL